MHGRNSERISKELADGRGQDQWCLCVRDIVWLCEKNVPFKERCQVKEGEEVIGGDGTQRTVDRKASQGL
jgi:hypothetical protein